MLLHKLKWNLYSFLKEGKRPQAKRYLQDSFNVLPPHTQTWRDSSVRSQRQTYYNLTTVIDLRGTKHWYASDNIDCTWPVLDRISCRAVSIFRSAPACKPTDEATFLIRAYTRRLVIAIKQDMRVRLFYAFTIKAGTSLKERGASATNRNIFPSSLLTCNTNPLASIPHEDTINRILGVWCHIMPL